VLVERHQAHSPAMKEKNGWSEMLNMAKVLSFNARIFLKRQTNDNEKIL